MFIFRLYNYEAVSELCSLTAFFMCAQHGQQLDGESPLWAW